MIDPKLIPSFFKGNRQKLFKSLSADILIISANGLMQKSADEAYPFRQDSNFWYLTGINEPDIILVKTKTEEFLIVPVNQMQKVSFVAPPDELNMSKISGVAEVLNKKDGWSKVDKLMAAKPKVATTIPSPSLLGRYGIYTNPARRHLVSLLKRRYPSVTLVDARLKLAAQRMVKQQIEIDLIQRATDITCNTLADVLYGPKLINYTNAIQIERDIHGGFIRRGAKGHAFDPVVAAGKNAAIPHYFDMMDQKLKNGQLIVADVGADYSFYGSDISRTVSYGQASSRQQAVFEAVRHVQAEAFKLIKPGIIHKDYEKQVEILVGKQLKELGVISHISRRSVRKHYPHLCSHSLGLDTHDSADYSLPLPENMVMVAEPGIYLADEGIGVRIEDVVRITKDGCEVMSASLPNGLKL